MKPKYISVFIVIQIILSLSLFFFFAVFRVYTVAVKAKVVNTQLFIASKRSKRLGSCKPLVTTFLSTD